MLLNTGTAGFGVTTHGVSILYCIIARLQWRVASYLQRYCIAPSTWVHSKLQCCCICCQLYNTSCSTTGQVLPFWDHYWELHLLNVNYDCSYYLRFESNSYWNLDELLVTGRNFAVTDAENVPSYVWQCLICQTLDMKQHCSVVLW